MNRIILNQLTGLMLLGLVLLWSGCNTINNSVEDALKTTKFELEPIDAQAAVVLGDSSIAHDFFKTKTAASVDTTGGQNTFTCPNAKVVRLALDAYKAAIDSLAANQAAIAVLDTAYKVTTSTSKMSAFAFDPGTNRKVVFYVTDYVNLVVQDENGNVINPNSTAIPIELSSACYRYNTTSKKPEPKIKTRAEYELASGNYLFKIVRTDQTLSTTFYLAILGE